jgi:hypothetical protein
MKDRELMERARTALQSIAGTAMIDLDRAPTLREIIDDLGIRIDQIKEDEAYYKLPKEARDKMKMAAQGNRNLWKPELDPKYQRAKELRASGIILRDCLKMAGLTTDQWYRRQRIEKHGRDRDAQGAV